MNAIDIMKCGAREQRGLAAVADGISKVVREHDSAILEVMPPGDESGSPFSQEGSPASRGISPDFHSSPASRGSSPAPHSSTASRSSSPAPHSSTASRGISPDFHSSPASRGSSPDPHHPPDDQAAFRALLACINAGRARVGMEIKLLTQYLEKTDSLLSDLETAIETLNGCTDPELADMAAGRAAELALSRTVCTQTKAACCATILQYREYAEMLGTCAREVTLGLKQSEAIELAEIYAKVRNAAKESCSGPGPKNCDGASC